MQAVSEAGPEHLRGRPVFVTGASGFIGRRLVDELVTAGARVTTMVRSRRDARKLRDRGVTAHVGALSDGERLTRALAGTDILFHLAYDVRAPAAANLAAFETILAAAQNAEVQRIVHTSSIVVYDDWPHADLTEESPIGHPGGSPYRTAKMAMEARLMQGPLPAAILQPTLVYGPGSALWTDQMAENLMAGTVLLPEPEGVCNAVFVDDVVQAMLCAAVVADLGQERFIVSGSEPGTWSALLEGYAAVLGRGALRHLPCADLAARLGPEPPDAPIADRPSVAARVSALARRVLGRRRFEALVRQIRIRLRGSGGEIWPDRHLFDLYRAGGRCSIARAKTRLGYRPQFELSAGLAATASYLKARYGAH